MSLSERQILLDAITKVRRGLRHRMDDYTARVSAQELTRDVVPFIDDAFRDLYDAIYNTNPVLRDALDTLTPTVGAKTIDALKAHRERLRPQAEIYITVGDLTKYERNQVALVKGIGPKALDRLEDALRKRGLRLKPGWRERRETL